MTKFFVLIIGILVLGACSPIESLVRKHGVGTVVSVEKAKYGCGAAFTLPGKQQIFFSEARTLYEQDRCRWLKIGYSVPVLADPLLGDYPRILFERIAG